MKSDIKKPTQRQIDKHREYMRLQREEMLGEVNMYFASKKLKRPVSNSEAIMHYIENGGAKDFFKRYGNLICPFPKEDS